MSRFLKSRGFLVSTGFVAVVAVAVWLLFGSGGGGHAKTKTAAATSTPSASASATATQTSDPATIAKEFLAAWAKGDYATAAQLTDDPVNAQARLTNVASELTASPKAAALGAPAPGGGFAFTVTYALPNNVMWVDHSSLTTTTAAGSVLVHFDSSVVHPGLPPTDTLELVPAATQVVDSGGTPLTTRNAPSLGRILTKLAGTKQSAGRPTAYSIVAVNPTTENGDAQLDEAGTPSGSSSVRTTVNAKLQAAVEQVVGSAPPGTGMAVVQPSTGDILAVGNNPPDGRDTALTAATAPGSTLKVITAAALLARGDSPSTAAPCDPDEVIDGQSIHNDGGESDPGADLQRAFEMSCNTSFIRLGMQLPANALANEAMSVFGFDQPWDIGLGTPTTYGNVTAPKTPNLQAADLYGQGDTTVNPLAMASVAATVDYGVFKQPIIVPGASQISAEPLADDATLKQLMRDVVSSSYGTATSLRGISSAVGAKTGTAEVNGGTDGWMIAFDGDYAVACMVPGGSTGDGSAGPLVARVLRSL